MRDIAEASSYPACASGRQEARVVEFAFVSSIYVFDCGHSTAVRTTRPSEQGVVQPCHECSAEQLVVEVITVG